MAGETSKMKGQELDQAPPETGLVVKPTPPDLFILHGSNREMRWEAMYGRGYLVPNELFYIRSQTSTPRIDAALWRLRVEGTAVSRTAEFTYDELLAMPSLSVVRILECAGNGRSLMAAAHQRKISGSQWKLGAVGAAEWTGAPLREVLDRVGVLESACDVMVEGLDDLKVNRPIPIAKALAEDTLLVYAMNGQVLPPDHGFPIRLLVPGWAGIASIKWVGRVEVSDHPLYSHWNTKKYILKGPGYKAEGPALGPPLTLMNIKSVFELPWNAQIPAGRRLLRGRSWSPHGEIASVEVSTGGGADWQPARLRSPNLPGAWVRWDLEWNALPGDYDLRARATDVRGNAQPEIVPFNDEGYLYNGIVEHPVSVR